MSLSNMKVNASSALSATRGLQSMFSMFRTRKSRNDPVSFVTRSTFLLAVLICSWRCLLGLNRTPLLPGTKITSPVRGFRIRRGFRSVRLKVAKFRTITLSPSPRCSVISSNTFFTIFRDVDFGRSNVRAIAPARSFMRLVPITSSLYFRYTGIRTEKRKSLKILPHDTEMSTSFSQVFPPEARPGRG